MCLVMQRIMRVAISVLSVVVWDLTCTAAVRRVSSCNGERESVYIHWGLKDPLGELAAAARVPDGCSGL
jgi:hypothetical protein